MEVAACSPVSGYATQIHYYLVGCKLSRSSHSFLVCTYRVQSYRCLQSVTEQDRSQGSCIKLVLANHFHVRNRMCRLGQPRRLLLPSAFDFSVDISCQYWAFLPGIVFTDEHDMKY